MALTTQPKRALFVQTMGLTAAPIVHGEEASGQTYKAGAFVQDDDSGLITECANSSITGADSTYRTIGMALTDASGTASTNVDIIWAASHTVFEATLSDANGGTHTLAAADKWKVYPIKKGTANWYLDAQAVSDTGGGVIVGFKDPIGTVDGRVYFVVTNTARGGINDSSARY